MFSAPLMYSSIPEPGRKRGHPLLSPAVVLLLWGLFALSFGGTAALARTAGPAGNHAFAAPGNALQALARELNRQLAGHGAGVLQCALGRSSKFALWPTRADATPLAAQNLERILNDLQAYLQKSAPECAAYLDANTIRAMAADLHRDNLIAKNLGDIVGALDEAGKDVDIVVFPAFFARRGRYFLALKATERSSGRVLATTPSDFAIPSSYTGLRPGDTALGLDRAITEAARALVSKTPDMTSLTAGNIYFQNSGAQPEFAIYLMERMLAAIGEAFADVISNRRLKIIASRARGIGVEAAAATVDRGAFQLDGSYWLRGRAVETKLCLRSAEGETACWHGRIRAADLRDMKLRPRGSPAGRNEPFKNSFSFSMITERGRNPVYYPGEYVRLKTRLGADAFLYCFYTDADNATTQILPNRKQAGRKDGYFVRRGILHAWPQPERDGFRFRINAKTLGEEYLRCFALDRNVTRELPPELRGRNFDPLPRRIALRLGDIFSALPNARLAQAGVVINVAKRKEDAVKKAEQGAREGERTP